MGDLSGRGAMPGPREVDVEVNRPAGFERRPTCCLLSADGDGVNGASGNNVQETGIPQAQKPNAGHARMSLRGRFRSMTVCGKMMHYGASIVISVSIVSTLIRFSLHAAIDGGEIMECDTRRSGRGDRRESSGAEVLACGEQCEGTWSIRERAVQ